MSIFRVSGKEFDAKLVPDGTTELHIERISSADLQRLKGLEALPIRHLNLRWLSAPDLSAIPFPEGLRSLIVWHSSILKSMNGIEQCHQLRKLEWRKNGLLEDGSALNALPHLHELEIVGDVNGNQKIKNLAFMQGLTLDKLVLDTIDGKCIDLEPLVRMRQPYELVLGTRAFEREEVAKVAAVNASLFDEIMNPKSMRNHGLKCDNCTGDIKFIELRRAKAFCCENCDKGRIDNVFSEFKGMVESARAKQ